MKNPFFIAIILSFILIANSGCMQKLMDHVVFQVKPSHATPSSLGLNYEPVLVGDAHRKVVTWFVKAPKSNTVVLIFKGLAESMTDWNHVQKLLYDENISSISFNYGEVSDTLKGKGSSRLSEVTQNVLAVLDTVRLRMPNADVFLLGHSVGNAVMLQILQKQMNLRIKGVIVCNAFSSIRNWAVYHKQFPKLFKFVIPRYFDNVKAIKAVHIPVFLVHSKDDKVNPYFMGVEVFGAAHQPKEMKTFAGYQHNDLYTKHSLDYWQPILEFMKK